MKKNGQTEILHFDTLRKIERAAVIARADGKTYPQLSEYLKENFGRNNSADVIRHWFMVGGKLEAAYTEYIEVIAEQSLKEAKMAVKRASHAAVGTMVELLGQSYDPNVRLGAAKAIANKYLPDRQVILDQVPDGDELPPELEELANKIVDANTDQPVELTDDAPTGAGVGEEVGGETGEEVPAALL